MRLSRSCRQFVEDRKDEDEDEELETVFVLLSRFSCRCSPADRKHTAWEELRTKTHQRYLQVNIRPTDELRTWSVGIWLNGIWAAKRTTSVCFQSAGGSLNHPAFHVFRQIYLAVWSVVSGAAVGNVSPLDDFTLKAACELNRTEIRSDPDPRSSANSSSESEPVRYNDLVSFILAASDTIIRQPGLFNVLLQVQLPSVT